MPLYDFMFSKSVEIILVKRQDASVYIPATPANIVLPSDEAETTRSDVAWMRRYGYDSLLEAAVGRRLLTHLWDSFTDIRLIEGIPYNFLQLYQLIGILLALGQPIDFLFDSAQLQLKPGSKIVMIFTQTEGDPTEAANCQHRKDAILYLYPDVPLENQLCEWQNKLQGRENPRPLLKTSARDYLPTEGPQLLLYPLLRSAALEEPTAGWESRQIPLPNWTVDLSQVADMEPIRQILDYVCDLSDLQRKYRAISSSLPLVLNFFALESTCVAQSLILCIEGREAAAVKFCFGTEAVENDCHGSRFIVYDIMLVFFRGQQQTGGHKESVIVDNEEKTVEFYDPNGTVAWWYALVSTFLRQKLMPLFPGYRFSNMGDYCPGFGPQTKTDLPRCAAYDLLIILTRLLHPELESKEIIRLFNRLDRDGHVQLLNRLICYVYDIIRDNDLDYINRLFVRVWSSLNLTFPDISDKIYSLWRRFDIKGLLDVADEFDIDVSDV